MNQELALHRFTNNFEELIHIKQTEINLIYKPECQFTMLING